MYGSDVQVLFAACYEATYRHLSQCTYFTILTLHTILTYNNNTNTAYNNNSTCNADSTYTIT